MPKLPAIAPITTPLIALRDADEEQDLERLTRRDRESLNSFVQNLNQGINFDEMGEELKSWWTNRYRSAGANPTQWPALEMICGGSD